MTPRRTLFCPFRKLLFFLAILKTLFSILFAASIEDTGTVTYSKESSTFSKPFRLTLSSTTPGCRIFYTIDGSDPSKDGVVYTDSIPIPKSMTVRACTERKGKYSKPKSQSFIRILSDLVEFHSALPILLLESGSSGKPARNTWQDGRLTLIESSEKHANNVAHPITLTERCGIKRRGNSSSTWKKFSTNIELRDWDGRDKKRAILGMPAESDWVLSGRLKMDRSLIRNDLAYQISRDLGSYAPRSRLVEAFVKTDSKKGFSYRLHYMGVYSVIEKIKKGEERVQPTKRPLFAGKRKLYILKKDSLESGEKGFKAPGIGLMKWVYPQERKATEKDHKELNQFFKRLHQTIGHDQPEKKPDWSLVDRPSLHSYHWMNTFLKNIDGIIASHYFYLRDQGSGPKLFAGPLWDFDRSMGSSDGRDKNPHFWNGSGTSSRYWSDDRNPFWGNLFSDPDFKQAHIDYWFRIRQETLTPDYLKTTIDQLTQPLRQKLEDPFSKRFGHSAALRNFNRWPSFPPRKGSHDVEIGILKRWLNQRLLWIDSQFLVPPQYRQEDGSGFLQTSEGSQIFYCLDGSDPRALGGKLNPKAISFQGGTIQHSDQQPYVARAYRSDHPNPWSAPVKFSVD